jgi:hypothetical protein
MNKFKFKLLLPVFVVGFSFVQISCVKENFDITPVMQDTSNLTVTAKISQIKKFHDLSDLPYHVKKIAAQTFWDSLLRATNDSAIIISGYVTSNDSAGNFYEVITIQDETGGIDIKINAAKLYSIYGLKPGQRVLVKLNDLSLSYYRGLFQIGTEIVDEGKPRLVGIDINQLSKYVVRSGAKKPVEPIELSISELNFSHVQKLVRVKNVQFWDATKAWAMPTVNTNRMVMDCENKSLIVRTSGYAYFSQNIVPNGNGSITGVLGRFNNDLQLMVRSNSDAELTGARCGGGVPVPNTTVKQLKAMCPIPLSSQTLIEITSDVVVEAVVAANDKSGNLFKQLFIQDATGGIEFKVDISSLHNDFPVGTKVVLNCKGMYLGTYGNVVQLGGLFNGAIGRLPASMFYPRVNIVGSEVLNPIPVAIGALHDSLVGMLVKFPEVQFISSELGQKWYTGSVTVDRTLEDFWGDRVAVRTSSFASFANDILPSNSGEFTAILSKYFTVYQLYVRTLDDVKLTRPRVAKITLLDETFASATLNQPISVNNWQSKMVVGARNWIAKDVSGNRCAEISAFNTISETLSTTWLISPKVDLDSISICYLSFKTQYSNWRDWASLEFFVSTNYDGADPTLATWTKVEDAYVVKSTDTGGVWVSSGIVNLNAFSGNVHFGFKYVRNGGVATQSNIFKVDDFQVFGKQ